VHREDPQDNKEIKINNVNDTAIILLNILNDLLIIISLINVYILFKDSV